MPNLPWSPPDLPIGSYQDVPTPNAPDTTQRARILTAKQIAEYAERGGFKGHALEVAVAVAIAESSGHTDAEGPVNSGAWIAPPYRPLGLWQIIPSTYDSGMAVDDRNRPIPSHTGPRDARMLLDPLFNARSAYSISHGGTNWRPWATYTSGAYTRHMAEAARAAAATGHGVVSTDPEAAANGVPTIDTAWAQSRLQPLRLGGTAKAGDLGQLVIDGQIDLTIKQPAQLTATFLDEDLSLMRFGTLQPSSRLQMDGQAFTVTDVQVVDTGTGPGVTVRCMPSGIVALMHTSAPSVTNILPVDYLGFLAKAAGTPVQKQSHPGYSRQDIAPQQVTATDTDKILQTLDPNGPHVNADQRPENGWEVMQRLALAEGYELWEDESGLFFGPATSFALDSADGVNVTWPGAPGGAPAGSVVAMNVPTVTFSIPAAGRYARVSVQAQLPPDVRHRVKLNRGIDLNLGDLLTSRIHVGGNYPHTLRVTRVSWPLGDLTAPISVEAESAVDAIGTDSPFANGGGTTTPGGITISPTGGFTPSTSTLPGGSTPLTPAQAADHAQAQVGGTCMPGTCMAWVGKQYGLAFSGWPRAFDGWYGTPASKRHPAGMSPPRGALLYWAGGSAGHVAIADGNGGAYSTDAPQIGRVGNVAIDWFTTHWRNKTYLGWAEPYFPHGG